MNKIQKKFEEKEMVDVYWGGQIEYDNESNKYVNVGLAHFEDCDALNQRWRGYQQAVKDTKENYKNELTLVINQLRCGIPQTSNQSTILEGVLSDLIALKGK